MGPGNNGGDGLVAARYLRENDHEVTLYIWKRDTKQDDNFRRLKQRRRGLTILRADNDPGYVKLREEIGQSALIVDVLWAPGVRVHRGRARRASGGRQTGDRCPACR